MSARLALFLGLGLLAIACNPSCASSSSELPPRPKGPSELYVSPGGNDKASGTREQPLLTLAAAIARNSERVVMLAGAHEGDATIDHPVELSGSDTGVALLIGHLAITASDVTVHDVNLNGGVSVARAKRVIVRKGRIASGLKEDTISLLGATAELSDLQLGCGVETCIQISTSTVTLADLVLEAGDETKRGIRVDTASVSARRVTVRGSQISQLQLGQWARAHLRDVRLESSEGSGLMALQGAAFVGEGLQIHFARRIGMVLSGARGRVERLEMGPAGSISIGVSGSDLVLIEPKIQASPDGALNMALLRDRAPRVQIVGGEIRHLGAPAAQVGAGELSVERTSFIGKADPKRSDPPDTIAASGEGTKLTIKAARFESAPGFALSFSHEAIGTVTATITGPGIGGIMIDNVAIGPIVITGTRIQGCLTGSGVVAMDASDLQIRDLRVEGCREAGVLAGQGSKVSVEASRALDNPLYGFAAFGHAQLKLHRSAAKGSKWATFASCSEGAEIEDLGENKLTGATTRCP